MNIKEIKGKWNKEKDYYRNQELGTGVHSFVRSFLESEDLFFLRESLLSTKAELRKNSYVHENKAKQGRQADFVVYINQDIVIPLEAECYGNISAGIQQLLNYQKDFDKQYGILTDGFTWRFYNNNSYRTFSLNQIFQEPSVFVEFWKDYIKPETYYLSFFEPRGQLSLLKETEILPVESNRQIFFADITKLISGFANKLQVEGYFNDLDKKAKGKKAIEISYAYIIQFILYKTLVDNGFDDFENEFNDIVEAIHKCLKVSQYGKILAIIEGISNTISKNVYRPFKEEQDFISQTLLNLIRKPQNRLHEVSPWLDIFVFIKKYKFSNIQNEIFGYVYENYLKELYEDEKRGQYFTDPSIVNFMLEQVGYSKKEIKNKIKDGKLDKLSLVDPACGSGTFLYSATSEIVKSFSVITSETSKQIEEIITSNVFGLDIAEFPLYLAEMSILMRILPLIMSERFNNPLEKKIKVFRTEDSIAEFIGANLITLGKQISFPYSVIKPKFSSFQRSEENLLEMKSSMSLFPRRRFDYVVANPPYIPYNECSKQKLAVFALMKKGTVQLSDIFGINLHHIPSNVKKYSPKPNLYAFFIALGLALLKDDGRLCYIIPQNVLTAGDLDVLRYHLARYVTLEKIITFRQNLFVGRGLGQDRTVPTSSLVLVVDKHAPTKTHEVEIINYKAEEDSIADVLNNIAIGKKIDTKKVRQSELLENCGNWNFLKQSKTFLNWYEEYRNGTDDISIYYQHTLAEKQFGSRFYFDIGFTLNSEAIVRKGNSSTFYELLDFKQFFGYTHFIPIEYYPRDRKLIELTQNNQGYVTLDQPYKIIWRIKNPDRFCFTDHPIIFYMGKASIICSDNKSEVLYLFSLLNSPISQLVLESNMRNEAEKEYLIPVKAVKKFIRIPRISQDNQCAKDEIISRTEEMLALEERILSDYVDFSSVLIQKFDGVQVEGKNLVLSYANGTTKLPIKGNISIVVSVIAEKYGTKMMNPDVTLSELRNLQVMDADRQKGLKAYIDDLVFSLYFNISLKKVGLEKSDEIHEICSKSKYYAVISK